MSIRDYENNPIVGFGDWQAAEDVLLADIRRQVDEAGLVFVKYMPNIFFMNCVIANAEQTKWVHVFTSDVRKNPRWLDEVGLCRMKHVRDLGGDAVFYCTWETIGAAVLEYLDDRYDDSFGEE